MTAHQNFGFLQTLVDDIEANLADEVNVLALSELSGLSPWHFQRWFKSLIGDTLGSYIRGRRLTRAAQLLLETNQSIIDIAVGVGFGSHEAFTRSFKAYFSMSPKEFRQQRPAVLLNEKPILDEGLLHHIAHRVTREPIIQVRPAISLVGFATVIPSPFATDQTSCHLMENAWRELFEQEGRVPGGRAKSYFGLTLSESGQFTEEELTHLAAIETTEPEKAPAGMVVHSLPEQTVAVFSVTGMDAEAVNRTIDFIYGYWLPKSGYHRGEGSDYEWMEQVEQFDASTDSKYVIPLNNT
ncbi:MAG: AraC family transcriptional regulator [Natronospirillum sp.]|uniref:AraC family transcriptional regulator n=1 Tax=Natronospirillum sp. TaxID=2812955 RepID=UPI0025CEEADD|nr:AraC family transcriptional regulator [Natronospirillum sp.]MCH8552982.1 AraC family transcriptional regulator [Natronospirillum sp.]